LFQLKEECRGYVLRKPSSLIEGYFYLGKYEKLLRELLLKAKFDNFPEIYLFIKDILLKFADEKIKPYQFNYLMGVPMHSDKLKIRGYNQVEFICKILNEKLGLLDLSNSLKRIKNTLPQNPLSLKERKANLKEAFSISVTIEKGKLLLIDDIVASGATTMEIASLLKRKNYKLKIWVFSLAKSEILC